MKSNQPLYVKEGDYLDFGFEPCANAFFDFYVTPKYTCKPLLQLEDVTFFLFLRKNVNKRNPKWKMPSVRQMMGRVGVSQRKLEGMMERLIRAGLLKKESGAAAGAKGENVRNEYLLSDPLHTLPEFLAFVAHGDLNEELKPEWREYIAPMLEDYPVRVSRTPSHESSNPVRELHTPPVREPHTHKQTSYKQTEWDDIWDSVLEVLKGQLPQTTYSGFVAPARLTGLSDGIATITIPDAKAKDWLENRLERQLRLLLSIESKTKIGTIHVIIDGI